MKRQILISLLVLLSVAGFAGAVELPGFGFYDLSQDELAAYRQGELIVRFADVGVGTQLPNGPVIMGPWRPLAIKSAFSDFIVAGAEVDREYDHIVSGLAVVELPAGTSVVNALIQFNGSANVLYAEPNYKYRLLVIPDDPMFSGLWGMHNTGQTGGTVDADIDAPEAWDIQTDSPDIIIAITDTGVDYSHPDLVDNMWVNTEEQNGQPDVDDDGNGYVDDIYGYDFAGAFNNDPTDGDGDPCDMHFHGTHAAGSAGAVGNNGEGIVGVCWNVKLMALKIFADDRAIVPDLLVGDAVEAIGYAVDNGARVINASWGGFDYSQSLYDAIAVAGDAGLLFVAGAGNDGTDNDENPFYPASYELDSIISVMSTDHDDQMSDFSNYGATSVDVAAPGSDILSTAPTFETAAMMVIGAPTDYALASGTSMSAPHVAGACALVWSKYPSVPNLIVKTVILKAIDPVLSSPRLCLSGGRINLHKALTLIPSGRQGEVLNSGDDPNVPGNLYRSIQAAIDDANDGDVLIAEADTLFYETIDFKGKVITLRSGDITQPSDPTISPENTYILGLMSEGSVVTFSNGEGPGTVLKGLTICWGSADYGGGIRCDGASPTITDCIISNNFAQYYGGGIDCYDSSPTIKNCTIADNRTSGSSGVGGGINCEQSSPVIANCFISNNFANSVGGGIACHNASPNIFNCVIANNSAFYKSGGIDLEYSSPTITNCTVVVDAGRPKDGGIFAYRDSFPVITNCILWGNGDDLYNCSATYSCIEDDDSGIGNIHLEPTFITGPLGDYYLSQTAAGQLSDSTCLDLGDPGTDPGLQIHTFTTRTNGAPDEGVVDMGAHYLSIDDPAWEYKEQPYKQVQLIIGAEPKGAGRVVPDPNKPMYWQYEVVRLTAYPEPGYRIKAWIGTDDDSSTELENTVTMIGDSYVATGALFEQIPLHQLRTEVIGGRGTISPRHRRGEPYPEGTVVTLVAIPNQSYIVDRWSGTDDDTSWSNTNTVTMDSDKDVTVLFRQPKSLHVPGQYPSIGAAINAAYSHGDKIVVSPGTYSGGYDFMGKAMTIATEHPDDPCSVAATIIETSGGPAFIFQSGEGPDSIVDGFTIQGLGDTGPIEPPFMGGIGESGAHDLGGAISCLNGSSPTLSHLIIKDCVARGQDGEDATFIFDPPDDPEDPLDPLEGEDALDDPPEIDPEDPGTYDPNNAVDPSDPNAPIDGMNGEDGADGMPGEAGMDGMEGQPGYAGGNGGVGYGGAMYFDANSSPIILNCTMINCQAIGGDGGFGGLGQDGQAGQDGQPGQPGQDGQNGQDGFNDGADGVGGNGGAGGDGGPGGNGGAGGPGGKGGEGGEALGGAIYFGPNCRPTIQQCTILNSMTRQGLGNYGGDGGIGGNGGAGADADAGGGGGDPDGEDGEDGADGPGGRGGDGGMGGDMGVNGIRSWGGAIFYGENCEISVSDTVISDSAATTIVPTYTYGGGDGGDGGIGGDGAGDASGGDGGDGGSGGAGGPPPVFIPDEDDGAADDEEPNAPNQGPGDGGAGGEGGDGGDGGGGGLGGFISVSFTSGYGGANYYEFGCKAELTDCTISGNASRQYDGSGLDGGGEYYESGCETILNRCEFIGNSAGLSGSGGGQFFNESCSAYINDCNYVENSSGHDGGGLFCWYDCLLDINDSDFIGNSTVGYFSSGGAVYGGGMWDWNIGRWHHGGTMIINNSYFATNRAAFGGGLYWHGEDADVSISDSIISSNTAEHGGGMYWSSGAPVITGCSFLGNRAQTRWFLPDDIVYQEYYYYFDFEKPYGGGGGMFCWSSDAKIENCFITGNSSSGSG
ncbi:MAG: S8 family serine peptidase, partial [Planctomycetota bacterium]